MQKSKKIQYLEKGEAKVLKLHKKKEIQHVLCPVSGRREGGAINSMDVITAPSLRYNSATVILYLDLNYI